MSKSAQAFTLLEVLLAVAVLGILAALAWPRLIKGFEGARAEQARVALRQIHAGQQIYRSGTGFFYPHSSDHPAAADGSGILGNLRVQLDEGMNWNYSVDTSTADDFTASAARTAGGNAGETLSIDETGALNETGWAP